MPVNGIGINLFTKETLPIITNAAYASIVVLRWSYSIHLHPLHTPSDCGVRNNGMVARELPLGPAR